MELAKFKVIQKSIDYHEELKEDHYEVFIEYVQDKSKNSIVVKLNLIHIKQKLILPLKINVIRLKISHLLSEFRFLSILLL